MRLAVIVFFASLIASCGPVNDDTSSVSVYSFEQPVRVYTARKVYTGNPAEPVVSGLVIGDNGRILATLPIDFSGEIFSTSGTPEVISRPDSYIYPGFVDGHVHFLAIGARALQLDFTGTSSIQELQRLLAAEVAMTTPGAVIYGGGWIETGWPEGRMPTASDLDLVAPDNPVILERTAGHSVVVNSMALALAVIDADTVAPAGGAIERTATGEPNGLLIDNAMLLVAELRTRPSEQTLIANYKAAADLYISRGWSGAHSMSFDPAHAALLQRLSLAGELPLRLHNAVNLDGYEIARDRAFETPTITNRAVKISMDGALGSRGALLSKPYADRPETNGLSLFETDQLETLMAKASEDEVQLAMHAIGDLANRRVLDAFEARNYGRGLRWRIEHAQILNPADIQRIADNGLIASMQTSHAIGDYKFAFDRVRAEDLQGAYAWNSLLTAGAVVVGGSDAPVELGSPLVEFYAAIARKDLAGYSTPDWSPQERISREQALALFTSAPAYAAFMEEDLGTLEVGKIADLTGFDRDIMMVPEREILEAELVLTVVNGEIVHQSSVGSH